tara:strand:+ start:63 stop:185 length:123 start_codon:yes stop_codon:yes gene_type:complete
VNGAYREEYRESLLLGDLAGEQSIAVGVRGEDGGLLKSDY